MQSAAPSDMGIGGDEYEEYELLDTLESEDDKRYHGISHCAFPQNHQYAWALESEFLKWFGSSSHADAD